MRFTIDTGLATRFPELRIAVVVARGIDNNGDTEALTEIWNRLPAEVNAAVNPSDLGAHPHIAAWRDVYTSIGIKLKKEQPTLEFNLKKFVGASPGSTNPLRRISKVVDLYRVVSYTSALQVGGYDLQKVTGDVSLRVSAGGEEFVSIHKPDPVKTLPGEIVYADDARVLTRRWNYNDSGYSQISEGTSELALFIEAPVAAVTTSALSDAAARLTDLIQAHCGGTTHWFLADASLQTEWQLD